MICNWSVYWSVPIASSSETFIWGREYDYFWINWLFPWFIKTIRKQPQTLAEHCIGEWINGWNVFERKLFFSRCLFPGLYHGNSVAFKYDAKAEAPVQSTTLNDEKIARNFHKSSCMFVKYLGFALWKKNDENWSTFYVLNALDKNWRHLREMYCGSCVLFGGIWSYWWRQ